MDVGAILNPTPNASIPQLAAGDSVRVTFRTIEGEKERVQSFQGVVIRLRRGLPKASFTVRRTSHGVGVERTFFFQSPLINKVEVQRHGKVRRARLYYLRELSAKEARLKERLEKAAEKQATAMPLPGAPRSIGATAEAAPVTAPEATPAPVATPAVQPPGDAPAPKA